MASMAGRSGGALVECKSASLSVACCSVSVTACDRTELKPGLPKLGLPAALARPGIARIPAHRAGTLHSEAEPEGPCHGGPMHDDAEARFVQMCSRRYGCSGRCRVSFFISGAARGLVATGTLRSEACEARPVQHVAFQIGPVALGKHDGNRSGHWRGGADLGSTREWGHFEATVRLVTHTRCPSSCGVAEGVLKLLGLATRRPPCVACASSRKMFACCMSHTPLSVCKCMPCEAHERQWTQPTPIGTACTNLAQSSCLQKAVTCLHAP